MKNAEQIEFQTVAKRYAQALSELCESHMVERKEVLKDLENIVEAINSSSDFVNLMKNPEVTKSEKQNVTTKIFEGKINKITLNFLMYLIEKDRFNIIPSILAEFQNSIDREYNIVNIEIISAVDLDDNMKQTIKDRLSGKLQKELKIDWSVDKDIIAGLVFVVGDSIVDTSLKSKLQMIGRNIIK